MSISEFQWLAGASGAWSLEYGDFGLRLRPYRDGRFGKSAFEAEPDGGADACVDSTGMPWVAWSEGAPAGNQVFAIRCEGGVWGPRLQVSTQGDNHDPTITADEYGNVWIVWVRYDETSGLGDLWMCRMGARSGQETFIAADAEGGPMDVLAREGRLAVVFLRSGSDQGDLWIVEGTEHQGFGEPVPVVQAVR